MYISVYDNMTECRKRVLLLYDMYYSALSRGGGATNFESQFKTDLDKINNTYCHMDQYEFSHLIDEIISKEMMESDRYEVFAVGASPGDMGPVRFQPWGIPDTRHSLVRESVRTPEP